MPRRASHRVGLFALLVTACVGVAVVAVLAAARSESGAPAAPAAQISAAAAKLPAAGQGEPTAVFIGLDRARRGTFGRVAIAPLADLDHRTLTELTCMRVSFAARHGVCLRRAGGVLERYEAVVFGPDFRARHQIRLAGIPSRTRVSPDGRYGTATVFVSGHSYATVGAFSTQATIFELATGKVLGELEKFSTTIDGKLVTARDRNFWGVTFAADSDRFYATMATGGKTYLIEGSVNARTARTIHENVECPSLSPDGTRIAFKKLVGNPAVWRFHVLDLETMKEKPLARTKPIDDQLAWLDDDHVLYHDGEETWTVPADGTGAPRRWLAKADSATIVR